MVTKPPFNPLNFPQNEEAHTRKEGTPSFRRRHTNFNCDKNRRIQTGSNSKRNARSLQTAHSRIFFLKFQHVAHVPSSFIFSQQESCSGTVKTAKEVSPATLSSPSTHPSFLGMKGPLPCGSLMPPVRAPNLVRKERPQHLTNFAGTMIVQVSEASQHVHNTFPASFLQARNNVLNRTVTIFLLVRQQPERIDQIFTKPLWRRVRFEHLCFIGIGTELHHQCPVGRIPFVFSSTHRAPATAMHLLSCCCCLRVPLIPTKCSPPMEDCHNAGRHTTKLLLPFHRLAQ